MRLQLERCRMMACTIALTAAIPTLLPAPASGLQLSSGDISARLDTTLTYGTTWRVQERDKDLVGIANGGNRKDVNSDDGDLNYDTGLVSNAAKITSELDLSVYDRFGIFARGKAFYDFENENGSREKAPLSSEAKDLVGSDISLLDAFAWGDFSIGNMPIQVRVGDQVVSWGESTFIGNSINAINPIDVAAFRLPGSELKEALLPEGMVWTSLGLTENISLEGLYLYHWQQTDIDPTGSYWSTNDYAGDGGTYVTLGDGLAPEGTFPYTIYRAPTREASDSGQYGAALRVYAPALNDTEFGFYYLNYHSRIPTISALRATTVGLPASAFYLTEYVEDLQLFGISANTEVAGLALQGEISYRPDMPLQIADEPLIIAALGFPGQISGTYGPGEIIHGYIERDVAQVQATLTKILGPVMGATKGYIIGEAGVMHVLDMPKTEELALDCPGNDADATSMGYRVSAGLTYSNAIGAIDISPRVAWRHDVQGISPGGAGFLEERKAVSFGLGFDYLKTWGLDISYTNFFGADELNKINDRDVVSASIKYSF
ncbi:DUF1302 domain-containing protein [Desulforhopalus singaporensis]|uniref:DUF1302 domain-containing protein n=1 Tax=Desulforhopalus singaporensis TaxID=91360 RepID=A0A1H0SDH9_9BACT|nr:DUF1302 domain-containing protein [Desulforhopalus singaporensis]SDP39569.1 Protein of unknown function [Desulforhopalus singaporensis]